MSKDKRLSFRDLEGITYTPFEKVLEQFNAKVEELLTELKSKQPDRPEAELRTLAEEMAAPLFYFSTKGEYKRPN